MQEAIIKKNFSNKKNILIIMFLVFGFISMLILWPKGASDGIKNALIICSGVVIPSLFPFMFISLFIINTGIAKAIGRIAAPITKFLFSLPGCAGAAIIMGLIGGYPVGARIGGNLVRKKYMNEKELQRLLCISTSAGPALLISAVGGAILQNIKAGVILYAAQISVSVIIGIFLGLFNKKNKNNNIIFDNNEKESLSDAFVNSVKDTATDMLYICGFILFFGALMGLFIDSGFIGIFVDKCSPLLKVLNVHPQYMESLFKGFFEVTEGILCAVTFNIEALPFIGLLVGFGGLSVHFQIFASLSDIKTSKLHFFISRIIHGICTFFAVKLLLKIFPISTETFNSLSQKVNAQPFFSSMRATIVFIVFCTIFLLSFPVKTLLNKKNK